MLIYVLYWNPVSILFNLPLIYSCMSKASYCSWKGETLKFPLTIFSTHGFSPIQSSIILLSVQSPA